MRRFIFAVLITVSSVIGSMALAGCEGSLPGGVNQAINPNNPNSALFSAAVRYYTNIERCRRGLTPLAADGNLLSAAVAHSVNMARANNMSHTLNVRGQRSMSDRMRSFSVSYRTAAENIAQNFLFAIVGRPISTSRNGQCGFVYADNGQPVPQHSYNSLAATQVAGWMASSKHRDNIMNRRVTRMEAGIGYAPDGQTCGRIYVSQNFAG